jgi:hypothetical protein
MIPALFLIVTQKKLHLQPLQENVMHHQLLRILLLVLLLYNVILHAAPHLILQPIVIHWDQADLW